MLGQLHIKNIGIIEELVINFDDGLNILTGETGAGKSLVIDSINIVTGGRISKDVIKSGTSLAFVSAYFFGEEDIILSREIYANGRSICKINNKMVTLNELKNVGGSLIDIHGQHDNQSLLNPKVHLELLDNFAGILLTELKEKYNKNLEEYKDVKKNIERNYGDPIERTRRLDLLKYQQTEIEEADLKKDEEQELNSRRSILLNAEKIIKNLSLSYENLHEKTLISVNNAISNMLNISNIDIKYQNILDSIREQYYIMQETSTDILNYINGIEFNENEQEKIEERLDLIFKLKNKYGNDYNSIMNYYKEISDEINIIENSENIIKELKEKEKTIKKELLELSKEIRKIRKNVSEKIENEINKELQDLEMKKSFVKFEFTELDEFSENGMDNIQMLIKINAGEELKPLVKIVSGGELSRIMLAIKKVLCEYDKIPTMIFDEIDNGVSGQSAKAVADKMKIIGKTHQVICVTHLPMIAAAGNSNFVISKYIKNNKTNTEIRKLTEIETINEIARILAGNNISEATLEHAKELRK